jgi:DivIVA domain-containing protein
VGRARLASISRMEGSVSNVQFTERKRGFDPDEVANYLRQIDTKIAGLRAMATEAVERAEQAEDRARQAERRAGSPEDDANKAASVLAMAQRTAESAVAEARADADAMLADARRDAEQARLSAEAQSQQMVADVRRELETSRAEHLEALRQEIAELTAVRDAVASDVEALESHLATQRERVAEVAAVLTRLADDPSSLGAVGAPEVTGAEAPPVDEPAPDIPHLAVAADAAGLGARHDDDAPATTEPRDRDLVDTPDDDGVDNPEQAVAEVEAWDPVSSWEPAPEPWTAEDDQATATAPEESPAWRDEPEPTAAVTGLFDDESPTDGPPAYDDGYGLFDADADAEAGDPNAESSFPLGSGAEDDDAMRAFFEGDLDEDEGRRWGRRRR